MVTLTLVKGGINYTVHIILHIVSAVPPHLLGLGGCDFFVLQKKKLSLSNLNQHNIYYVVFIVLHGTLSK